MKVLTSNMRHPNHRVIFTGVPDAAWLPTLSTSWFTQVRIEGSYSFRAKQDPNGSVREYSGKTGSKFVSRNLPAGLNAWSQTRRRRWCSARSRVPKTDRCGCNISYHGPLIHADLDEWIAAIASGWLTEISAGPDQVTRIRPCFWHTEKRRWKNS